MVKFVKDSYRNLKYFISNINKRRGVLIFSNLKGGECFFHSDLGLNVILSNLKKGECNYPKKLFMYIFSHMTYLIICVDSLINCHIISRRRLYWEACYFN